ncbi:SRPBCC family protein [Microbispora sp. NPDC049125]|uniref:SRPBCC family protein n=1 Tax=Microbispora sp. NPDC049125 TaxID=3154929 RepID=UPI003465D5B3
MRICEQMVVDAPAESVYGLYADLAAWKRVLPDVVDVEVHYMDAHRQEFSMTVERPGGLETVSGVRHLRAPHELELVQTTPPPGLAAMRGTWTFTPENGKTTVTASREFTLLDPDGDEQRFAEKLRGFLRTNLDLFRRAAEGERVH